MSAYIIEGGHPLDGSVRIHGAKNSVLPILAACLLAPGECVIHNCPELSDVAASLDILRHLGCRAERQGDAVVVDASAPTGWDVPDALMREMRSSVIFLGAILGRMGRAELCAPGGCELGPRPIDLHLGAIRGLGGRITEDGGGLRAEGALRGADLVLSLPSVGATENAMLAAACADGETDIINAAREPEISDLADFLNGMGACIHGAGEGEIHISGVPKLGGAEHTVIPDRIAAATFICAAAVTRGSVVLKDIIPAHLGPVIPAMEEMGCEIAIRPREIAVTAPVRLRAISTVRTMPYPGFPTDAQAPVMAAACTARGASVFVENIFESRFKHVSELIRLGAHIKVEGRVAVVEGVAKLSGAPVTATDLRGGAALAVAGLAAAGTTRIENAELIDRGYERIEESLTQLGADVKRVNENAAADKSKTAQPGAPRERAAPILP